MAAKKPKHKNVKTSKTPPQKRKKPKTPNVSTDPGSKRTSSAKSTRTAGNIWDRTRQSLQGGSSTRRAEFWKPQIGNNTVRLFSFSHEDENHLTIRDDGHWYETEDGRRRILCLGGAPFPGVESCPICLAREQFPEDVWNGTRKQSGLKPTTAYLINAWVYALEEHKIAQFPKSIVDGRRGGHKGLLEVVEKFMEDGGSDPLDLTKGRDFIIKRTGAGFDTVYGVSLARKTTKFKTEVTPTDLFRFLTIPTQQEAEDVRDMLLEKYS